MFWDNRKFFISEIFKVTSVPEYFEQRAFLSKNTKVVTVCSTKNAKLVIVYEAPC